MNEYDGLWLHLHQPTPKYGTTFTFYLGAITGRHWIFLIISSLLVSVLSSISLETPHHECIGIIYWSIKIPGGRTLHYNALYTANMRIVLWPDYFNILSRQTFFGFEFAAKLKDQSCRVQFLNFRFIASVKYWNTLNVWIAMISDVNIIIIIKEGGKMDTVLTMPVPAHRDTLISSIGTASCIIL